MPQSTTIRDALGLIQIEVVRSRRLMLTVLRESSIREFRDQFSLQISLSIAERQRAESYPFYSPTLPLHLLRSFPLATPLSPVAHLGDDSAQIRSSTPATLSSPPVQFQQHYLAHKSVSHNPISRPASSKFPAPSTHNGDSQPSVGSNCDRISLLSDTPSPRFSPSKPGPSAHSASTIRPAARGALPPSSLPSSPLATQSAPPSAHTTKQQSPPHVNPVHPQPAVPNGSTAPSLSRPPAVPDPPAARSPSLPLPPTRPPSPSPSPEPSDGPSTPQKKQSRKKKGQKITTYDESPAPKPKRARSPRQREKRKAYQKRAKNDARMPALEGIPRLSPRTAPHTLPHPAPYPAPHPAPHTRQTSPDAVPHPISQPIDGERSPGLRNPRNDCYSLGYLQNMFCIRSNINHTHDAECDPESLPHALQSVLQEMADNPDGVVDAAGFRRACATGVKWPIYDIESFFIQSVGNHLMLYIAHLTHGSGGQLGSRSGSINRTLRYNIGSIPMTETHSSALNLL
ncbi:hypothetical protein DL93DRAFT_2159638 [Clavulina sp. PMI_390]|nr:hypothetical protein DL93DRAFT_2159638 [Clavulina sp. PMI_390]